MHLQKIINDIYRLSDTAYEALSKHFEIMSLSKGYALMQSNRYIHSFYIIKQGIARAYTIDGNKEVTFWFGKEGDPIVSMNNYVSLQPSYECIELMEDSILYKIDHNILNYLYSNNLEIANWGRKFAELELIKTETRVIELQCKTASERYHNLITHTPDLLKRIPLGIIASYLGISQVSLSRIRAQIS